MTPALWWVTLPLLLVGGGVGLWQRWMRVREERGVAERRAAWAERERKVEAMLTRGTPGSRTGRLT